MEILGLFRYKGSKKVYDTLLEYPAREFTIRELAKEAHIPFSSTRRIISLWEPAGIVEVGKLGKSRVIRFHKSPFTNSITKIMSMNLSPQGFTSKDLKGRLKKESGIKIAYLFGSTARKEETLKSDIDLAIYTEKKYDPEKLMFDIARKYNTKVVPLTFDNLDDFNKFLKDKEKVRLK